jgi:hypothetical protein
MKWRRGWPPKHCFYPSQLHLFYHYIQRADLSLSFIPLHAITGDTIFYGGQDGGLTPLSSRELEIDHAEEGS